MKTKTLNPLNLFLLKILCMSRRGEQGLTLVEAVVSLLIFFVALAGIVPVFLNYTISTINNERRTAAIAVSEQVLDGLRRIDVTTLPDNSSTPVTLSEIDYMGKTYTPTVTYCQNPEFCGDFSRHITLQVSHNGNEIYQAETVFTQFE